MFSAGEYPTINEFSRLAGVTLPWLLSRFSTASVRSMYASSTLARCTHSLNSQITLITSLPASLYLKMSTYKAESMKIAKTRLLWYLKPNYLDFSQQLILHTFKTNIKVAPYCQSYSLDVTRPNVSSYGNKYQGRDNFRQFSLQYSPLADL